MGFGIFPGTWHCDGKVIPLCSKPVSTIFIQNLVNDFLSGGGLTMLRSMDRKRLEGWHRILRQGRNKNGRHFARNFSTISLR